MKLEGKSGSRYRPEMLKEDAHVAPAGEKQRIYDPSSGQIWELTAIQAQVWDHADGQRTVAELAGSLRDAGHRSATEKTVWQALAAFHKAKLLAEAPDATIMPAAMGRRSALKRLGAGMGAAVALGILGVDRRAFAKEERVLICHRPGDKEMTLEVAKSSAVGHGLHGDYLGQCTPTPPP